MSKQKTFWAPFSGLTKNHLWTREKFPDFWCGSACGFRRRDTRIGGQIRFNLGDDCKNCIRALET